MPQRSSPRITSTCLARVAVVVALSCADFARAQIYPAGPDFQINSLTTDHQRYPAIAVAAGGGFVVAWVSDGTSTPGTNLTVEARRFGATGAPLGGQIQVSNSLGWRQRWTAIAGDGLGNFVVAWVNYLPNLAGLSSASIQARRFDTTGAPLGEQFQVNTLSANFQEYPAIAIDGAGGFVVVWNSYGSTGGDTSSHSIQGRRFDASGTPLGGQFQVNTYTTQGQWEPTVAAHQDGSFVVAWQSWASSGPDVFASIQAQRFDADGVPVGGEFQVNTYGTSYQLVPSVAATPSGGFVVAWTSFGSSGPDDSNTSIQGQVFDAGGDPIGSEFQINSYTTSYQWLPSVAVDAAGSFVVVWESDGSHGSDTSQYSVQGRRFGPGGVALGPQLQINTYTTSRQAISAVSADATGDFVITWQSLGSRGTDTSGYSIQARRFCGLFCDGFESGDASAWSAVVP